MTIGRLHTTFRQLSGQCCLLCKTPGDSLCGRCLHAIDRPPHCCRRCGLALPQPTETQCCGKCLLDPPEFASLDFIGSYHKQLADMLVAAKIGRQVQAIAALKTLIRHDISQNMHSYRRRYADFALLAVPTPKLRLLRRGFNLPRWAAKILATELGLQLLPSSCVKLPWYAPKQAKMSRQQRQKNRHKYQICDKIAKKVVIVDDIVTTGNTVGELATKLRRKGCEKLAVWAIARTQND